MLLVSDYLLLYVWIILLALPEMWLPLPHESFYLNLSKTFIKKKPQDFYDYIQQEIK